MKLILRSKYFLSSTENVLVAFNKRIMYIQFCFAVFISSAAFATSENNGDGLNIVAIAKANVRADGNRRNQTDERTKRAVSDSDRDVILNAFNCRRSLVGASDMNYLSWDSSLENQVNSYIMDCNFDAKFNPTVMASFYYYIRVFNTTNIGHKGAIEWAFTASTFTNTVKSKYFLQVSGSYKYCTTFTGEGRSLTNIHFYVYALTATSQFNESGSQYTKGKACTLCQDGVNWCYNNLCRGDCSNSALGCCPITNRIPAQCESSNLMCASSGIKVKTSIMMVAMALAFNSYFQ